MQVYDGTENDHVQYKLGLLFKFAKALTSSPILAALCSTV